MAPMTPDRFAAMMARAGIEYDPAEVFEAPVQGLLGTNPKVAKGAKRGYATAILHLSPSRRSGFQTCASATAGCSAACLNTAGRGGVFKRGTTDNPIQAARRRRTHWFYARRDEFMAALDGDIRAHVKRSQRLGLVPCVRLNGTSDIRWETIRDGDGRTVFDRHPDVTFYDYTKHHDRDVSGVPNYSLTFSLAESNDEEARHALELGMNVAAVFHKVPAVFMGRPVIDGDETDLRFLDPAGVIVGLKAKGQARTDTTSGFVR